MNREQKIELIKLKREKAKRKARANFWSFCLFINYDFFSKRPVLNRIANAFQHLYEHYAAGEVYRVSASLPPRYGKSYITTLFSVWMLGKFPKKSVMRNCCSANLRNKFSKDARNIILENSIYQEVFPDVKMRIDSRALDGWTLDNSEQGSYFGAGVDGQIIGFGASMLAITDDLFKSFFDANSDKICTKTWEWKEGAHDSRLEGNCCSIDIGTRWSKKDVIGRLRDRKTYYNEIVVIPALDEQGQSTCDQVRTSEQYQEIKDNIADMIWFAEYMQKPIDAIGLLFPSSQLRTFTIKEIKGRNPDGKIAATDTADRGTDSLCTPIAKIFGDQLYLVDVVFTTEPVEITAPIVSRKLRDWKVDECMIESNAGGRIFANEVRRIHKESHGHCHIDTKFTSKDKATRIIMKSGWIKSHVWFRSDYKTGSDYAKFMDMLTSYSKEGDNAHDDAPDGLTILAEFYDILFGDQILEDEPDFADFSTW